MMDTTEHTMKCITDVEVLRKDFTWFIKNISFVTSENEKKIKSSIFTVGNNREYKWRLRLYPNGNGIGSRDCMALYLQLIASTHEEVPVKFKFFIIMADGRKLKISSHDMRFISQQKSLGDHEFINRKILLDETNGFIADDNLTILCELRVGTGRRYQVIEDFQSFKVRSDDPENLIKHLEILLENKTFADVELIGKDGKEPLLAHKSILAARSPVFAAMFQYNVIENTCNKVEITDVTTSVLKQMIRFMYTGKTENLDDVANVIDLLVVADKYMLDDLKYLCEQAIAKTISLDTAIMILEIADKYNATKLKNFTINFMNANARQLVRHFINSFNEHNGNPARIGYYFTFLNL